MANKEEIAKSLRELADDIEAGRVHGVVAIHTRFGDSTGITNYHLMTCRSPAHQADFFGAAYNSLDRLLEESALDATAVSPAGAN